MSKIEKMQYLRRRRWRRAGGNAWIDQDGERLPFGSAVREQLARGLDRGT
jgi:hypothetical protein